jgi:tetratricopeptide (TPR) repeat protein
MPRKKDTRDRNERVEDFLRPAPYLGHDRDMLARHLMACGAFRIAESQFRRAVWLNPFEARFKQHLALCLYEEKQCAEARDWITKSLEQEPDNAESQRILKMIEERLRRTAAGQAANPGS